MSSGLNRFMVLLGGGVVKKAVIPMVIIAELAGGFAFLVRSFRDSSCSYHPCGSLESFGLKIAQRQRTASGGRWSQLPARCNSQLPEPQHPSLERGQKGRTAEIQEARCAEHAVIGHGCWANRSKGAGRAEHGAFLTHSVGILRT